MKLSKFAEELFEEISKLEIIDAHEHLPPEKEYLEFGYCGLNFFAGYIYHDMASAGMPERFKSTMREAGFKPASLWWPKIAPYWEKVRHGTYAKAALITARDLYGISEINDRTIDQLASCIMADNMPGLYKRILVERCKSRVVITNVDNVDFQDDPYIRVVPLLNIINKSPDSFQLLESITGKPVNTLNGLVHAACERLEALRTSGRVVGFKSFSSFHGEPDEYAADAVFKKIKAGETIEDISPLEDYLFDKLAGVVADMGVPVALHAGVWGDFRKLDPKYTIYLAQRYPNIHFDLFHLGIPMVRDALIIAKNFPNVSLNLCWSPIVSQKMTARTLDETIDLVPMNKIIAFGGDYRCVVQKAWGHLVMAREVVASVLADRVESGDMTVERALDISKMWFHDNPSEIYSV